MKIMLFYFLFTYFYLWLLPSYSPIMFYDEKYDRKCDRFISMMIYDELCRILCRNLCIILYCYVCGGFKKLGGAISSYYISHIESPHNNANLAHCQISQ